MLSAIENLKLQYDVIAEWRRASRDESRDVAIHYLLGMQRVALKASSFPGPCSNDFMEAEEELDFLSDILLSGVL